MPDQQTEVRSWQQVNEAQHVHQSGKEGTRDGNQGI